MTCEELKKIEYAEIIKRVSGSDEELFDSLYICYKGSVLRWILSQSISKPDALEIYQITMIALYDNIKDGKLVLLTSSLDTYLISIARNKISEMLRREGRYSILDETMTELRSDLEEAGLDMENVSEERIDRIVKAFSKLKPKDKKILNLFYYKGEGMKKIAEKLGFSSEKVAKNEKYRSMNKLKELVKKL